MSEQRLSCVCLGCRRTRKAAGLDPEFTEWVCGKHWSAVPRHMRRRLTKIRRMLRRRDTFRLRDLEQRMWARCRDRAIEEALMGVQP